MRRRARIDGNQPAVVKDLRKLGFSVRLTHQLDDGGGDFTVGARGRNFMFELKDPAQPPNKRALTEKERNFRDEWRGQIAVAETVDDVLRVIQAGLKL